MNLNKNIKAFFIDLDGTLLDEKENDKRTISQENIDAIKKFQSVKGQEVIISTGRYDNGVIPFMEKAQVRYAVTGNGSRVIDFSGKVYKNNYLKLRQSLLIIEIAKRNKLCLKFDGSLESYGNTSFYKNKLSKKFGFYPIPHYNMQMHKRYNKIVVWGKSKGKLKKVANEMREIIGGLSIVTSANGWTLEISNVNSTKGLGNKLVCEKILNINPKTQAAHMGDTMNDSTTAGIMRLIVMGNAKKDLKSLSNFRGPHYKPAGVAKILRGEYKELNGK